MKLKLIMLSVFFTASAMGFEINTHQAITKCALSDKCTQTDTQKGAENLNYFALTMKLAGKSYKTQKFDIESDSTYTNYGGLTYFNYATNNAGLGGRAFVNGKLVGGKFIGFKGGQTYLEKAEDIDDKVTNLLEYSDTSYISLIEAGSILEDAVFPINDNDGDGRFNNHFYSAQRSIETSSTSFNPIVNVHNGGRLSNRASYAKGIADAYGTRTDAISWALDDTVKWVAQDAFNTHERKNHYTITDAFKYFRNSFNGTLEEREKDQAKLFVTLGHLVHLMQDLHSPAHVRNGPHAGGDYLEIFGRHPGGFYLNNGTISKNSDPDIVKAVADVDIKNLVVDEQLYVSYQNFFANEADWVSRNFFSEAHKLILLEDHLFNEDAEDPGVLLGADRCGVKRTTIFDSFNESLAELQTSIEDFQNVFWNKILTFGNASLIPGDISNNTTVAFERNESTIWSDKCRTMAAPKLFGTSIDRSYNDFNKEALKNTAKNVIPRAVASTQAFIDFFFRARIEASLSFDDEFIIIKNVSNTDLIGYWDFATLRKDLDPNINKSFSVYHVDENDVSSLLGSFPLYEDIQPTLEGGLITNNKYAIKIGSLLKDRNITIDNNESLIVLFEGQIGQDVGRDQFNLDAKGMSAAYVKKSGVKQTEQARSIESLNNFDDSWYGSGIPHYYIRNPKVDFDDPSSVVDVDTVLDVVTGLQWQDNADVGVVKKTWTRDSDTNNSDGDTANTYCESLTLAGYSDWRLPNSKELMSIVDYGRRPPTLNTAYFQNHGIGSDNLTREVAFWTADSVPYPSNLTWPTESDESYAYAVLFNNGRLGAAEKYKNLFIGGDDLENAYSVRCVRNSNPNYTWADEQNFTVKQTVSSSIVIDNQTKLKWQLFNPKTFYFYEEALEYCHSLKVDGGGWRVPNVNELISIADYSKVTPGLSDIFADDVSEYPLVSFDYTLSQSHAFWSSTYIPGETELVYGVKHFLEEIEGGYANAYRTLGTAGERISTGPSLLRCVK